MKPLSFTWPPLLVCSLCQPSWRGGPTRCCSLRTSPPTMRSSCWSDTATTTWSSTMTSRWGTGPGIGRRNVKAELGPQRRPDGHGLLGGRVWGSWFQPACLLAPETVCIDPLVRTSQYFLPILLIILLLLLQGTAASALAGMYGAMRVLVSGRGCGAMRVLVSGHGFGAMWVLVSGPRWQRRRGEGRGG